MIEQKQYFWTSVSNFTLKCRLSFLGLAIIVIVLDQVTKQIARNYLGLYQLKPFLKFWDWTLIYNQGAAFGFLADHGGWQKVFFALVAFLVAIGLSYYILKKTYSIITGIAFSFILGGAVGNLIDRLVAGKVTDFIYWHIGSHYWPAFNIADSFVCVGVTLLLIESVFFNKDFKN